MLVLNLVSTTTIQEPLASVRVSRETKQMCEINILTAVKTFIVLGESLYYVTDSTVFPRLCTYMDVKGSKANSGQAPSSYSIASAVNGPPLMVIITAIAAARVRLMLIILLFVHCILMAQVRVAIFL